MSREDEALRQKAEAVMTELTKLSTAAREAKDRRLTRMSNDLYYASNRAWRELDGVINRERKS